MPFYGAAPLGQAVGMLMPTKANLWYGTPISGVGTSAAHGVGTLRTSPLWVPRPCTVDRIGLDVTGIGDVGSKVRLGIFKDDGSGYPGTLLLDAGTIAGDSASTQAITISQALVPGLYWLASVVQDVTTLQPTLRTGAVVAPNIGRETSGSTNVPVGYVEGAIGGALPGVFTAIPQVSASAARVLVRVTT